MAWEQGAGAAEPATTGKTAVLVLPFTPLNPAEAQPWLGKSIQQSMVADLMVAAPRRVLSADASAADAAAAVETAKHAGAAYVLFGNFATAGDDLRVTGQLFETSTGKAVSAIKATGPVGNVFTLEDELAAQVRRRLPLTPPLPANGSIPADESVPPMEPLRLAQAPQPADPYVQTYVAPLSPSSSADRRQLDYDYYLGQTANSTYFPICGWYGYGIGWGLGFSYYGGYWGGGSAWGGFTHAAHGTNGVNPTAGTPIAPGVVFHPTSHASAGRAGGGGHQ